MKFEWDETKNRENFAKHGLDFVDAPEVFESPVLEHLDTRCDYGEDRWIAVGLSRNVLCVVLIYTEPNRKIIRIISFRKADKYERQHTSKRSQTDWNRVMNMKDEEIDYSDIPELREDFFKNAHIRWPGNKKQLTLRLDPDVVDYFKHLGKGYQSTMNNVLRKYMEAHQH